MIYWFFFFLSVQASDSQSSNSIYLQSSCTEVPQTISSDGVIESKSNSDSECQLEFESEDGYESSDQKEMEEQIEADTELREMKEVEEQIRVEEATERSRKEGIAVNQHVQWRYREWGPNVWSEGIVESVDPLLVRMHRELKIIFTPDYVKSGVFLVRMFDHCVDKNGDPMEFKFLQEYEKKDGQTCASASIVDPEKFSLFYSGVGLVLNVGECDIVAGGPWNLSSGGQNEKNDMGVKKVVESCVRNITCVMENYKEFATSKKVMQSNLDLCAEILKEIRSARTDMGHSEVLVNLKPNAVCGVFTNQKVHVEVAKSLAKRFEEKFGIKCQAYEAKNEGEVILMTAL